MKNECAKTRPHENPYEIWVGFGPMEGWEWRVLKKWQNPEKEKDNPYARWFCSVTSPMMPADKDGTTSYEMGDTYVKDVIQFAKLVSGKPDLRTVMRDEVDKKNMF